MTYDLSESILIKQSLNHRVQAVDAILTDFFVPSDFAPGIEKLIRCKQRAHFTVHTITNNAEGVIFHQFRYVTGITSRELNIRIMQRGFFTNRTFKFKYD